VQRIHAIAWCHLVAGGVSSSILAPWAGADTRGHGQHAWSHACCPGVLAVSKPPS
jgi:hypothetical protein